MGLKKAGRDLATNIHTQGLLQERIQSKCNRKEIHSRGYQRGPPPASKTFFAQGHTRMFFVVVVSTQL